MQSKRSRYQLVRDFSSIVGVASRVDSARQYVQHGRGIALPAFPADAADADPAEQLSV
jgi:hypothetical protein